MDLSSKRMIKAKSILSTIGSMAAAAMVTRTIVNDFLPPEIHDYLSSTFRSLLSYHSSEFTLIINELDGYKTNLIFEAAELYLGTLTTNSFASSTTNRLCVTKPESEKSIHVAVDQDQETLDEFEGVKFTWVLHCEQRSEMYKHTTIRSFHLTFHKRYKQLALENYLSYIIDQADLFKQENKAIKLFSIEYASEGSWDSVNLNHPSNFETLAMDQEMKDTIIDDLDRFLRRKEYYRRVGKAWKRGYLLYGPPGTGKSSLIAAMANYLNFDIYDLDLSELKSDSDLRKLLVGTGNRSIIVVEDIDCTVEFKDREKKAKDSNNQDGDGSSSHVTLSGFLNFIDGLWSSCGDARIIIFTTNHKDKLDPALLRPGRMDMHIHMSYCTPSGFRVLARNYLGVKNHDRFEEIEGLIVEGRVTPAEVAEQLIKHDLPSAALDGLLDFLRAKKTKTDALLVTDGGANGGNVGEVGSVGQSVIKL